VPGLGNLPLAGRSFASSVDTTQREEVIILLTPHIVKDDEAYAQASENEMKEMDKLRVGVRKGMMWVGRDAWPSAATNGRDEMAKPNPDRSKARWNLDCASNLNRSSSRQSASKDTGSM